MSRDPFVTNHAKVLAHLKAHPDARGRDVSAAVGITERAVQRIVTDLEATGHVAVTRVGRRNRYVVNTKAAVGEHTTVADLLRIMS